MTYRMIHRHPRTSCLLHDTWSGPLLQLVPLDSTGCTTNHNEVGVVVINPNEVAGLHTKSNADWKLVKRE